MAMAACCSFAFAFAFAFAFVSTAAAAAPCCNLTSSASSDHVWPELYFNWRSVLGTITGFIGAALGTAGGVGGGSIFVPTANLVLGFDTKSSAALSKCMIMGASFSTIIFNVRLKHPLQDSPLVDYDLAMLLQPMLLLGISIGVIFNVIFPSWVLKLLLVVILLGTSVRTGQKAAIAWQKETIAKKMQEDKIAAKQSDESSGLYEPLDENKREGKSKNSAFDERKESLMGTLKRNIWWKNVAVLCSVWILFLILQILQSKTQTCSVHYWIISFLQVPVAVLAFLMAAIKLYRMTNGPDAVSILNQELQPVRFGALNLGASAVGSLVGGFIAGMVGLGGGFALGPILLEFGVHPQVFSATATFAMCFSSSMSVVEYYLLHRFPVPYALYLFAVSIVGGFSGQYIMQSLIRLLGRASIIVILLTCLAVFSALLLGGLGIQDAISEWRAGEYMGFSSLC